VSLQGAGCGYEGGVGAGLLITECGTGREQGDILDMDCSSGQLKAFGHCMIAFHKTGLTEN
jgi:hypothetical protein